MSFPVKLFTSDQTGAPTLNGTAGSIIAVLDACLLNGFNTITWDSVTYDGAKAIATKSAGHGYKLDEVVLMAGADQSEYNGEKKIIYADSTTVHFNVTGSPASPATGTITAKIAPVGGWTKPFTGTNKAVYRIPLTGSGHYLRVKDDGVGNAHGARTAMCWGYETMTDVDTGTGLMPSTSQQSFGSLWRKSNVLDSNSRKWALVGDDRFFYLFTEWNTSYPNYYGVFCFGDIVSYRPNDAYGVVLMGDYQDSSSPSWPGQYNEFATLNNTTNLIQTQPGKFIARNYTQLGSSILIGMTGDYNAGGSTMGAGNLPFPSPLDNGFYVAPLYINHGNVYRGRLPGFYQPLHNKPLIHGDKVGNVTGLPGAVLMMVGVAYGSGEYRGCVDIAGPWR